MLFSLKEHILYEHIYKIENDLILPSAAAFE